MNDLERVLHEALMVLLASEPGDRMQYTQEDLQRIRARFGGEAVVSIDTSFKAPVVKLHLASRADVERERAEQEHTRLGHVLCECGNWIQRERNGWSHVGGIGDVSLHIPSPA